jgi:O-antigen/teichoic acid export membrane protein
MIARKSALIIVTEILSGSLGYVSLFFITRYMEPSDYGIVAFALGFVTLFSVFENMGYHQSHIKKISEGKDLGICNGTFLVTKIGLTVLMVIVVLISIIFWKEVLGRGFETAQHELAIYIMLGYMTLRSIAYFFNVTFRAKREIAKRQISIFFETLVRVGATIYVAIAGYGAVTLAFTYIIGDIAFLFVGILLFKGYPIKKPSTSYFREYTTFAIPLIIVVASSTIMNNFDRIFIQLFWSASDVGYYFAAFKLSRFIDMFAIALVALLFPTYSALHATKNVKQITHLTFQSERYISMIVFPMVFGIVLLAEPATFILLSGWMPAIPILRILPFFALLAALEAPYQSQFVGTNRPKLARNRVIIMVFCNVILNFILVPKDIQSIGLQLFGLGAQGAAIATISSYGVGLIYSRVFAWKITGVKGNWRIVLHAIAAIIMSILMYIILYYFDFILFITRWYHLLGFSLFSLGIYITLLYLLKEFTKKDFQFFLDTLNIKKMLSYILDELRLK